jgi:hypothetical protein
MTVVRQMYGTVVAYLIDTDFSERRVTVYYSLCAKHFEQVKYGVLISVA